MYYLIHYVILKILYIYIYIYMEKNSNIIIVLNFTFKNLIMKGISLLKLYNSNSHVFNFINVVKFKF
jgi:hypothetical protein